MNQEEKIKDKIQCLICKKWYKEITNSHLFYIHGQMTPEQYKKEFKVKDVCSDETKRILGLIGKGDKNYWYGKKRSGRLNPNYGRIFSKEIREKISKVQMGQKRYEKWTKEKVIESLKILDKRKESLLKSQIIKKYHGLYDAAVRHFNSWENACKRAGVEDNRLLYFSKRKWSKDKIIKQIREIKERNEPVLSTYVSDNCPALYSSAIRYFGGWVRAREAAFPESIGEIKDGRMKRNSLGTWTKKLVIKALKELYKENIPIKVRHIEKNNRKLFHAINAYFDTWENACLFAGIDIREIKTQNIKLKWTKGKILNDIKEINNRREPLYPAYIKKNYSKLYNAAIRNFGGWLKARSTALSSEDEK